MKRTLTLLLALFTVFALFSCSSDNGKDPLAYDYDLSEYVTLPDYMGMKFENSKVTPSDTEIADQKKADFAGKDVSRAVQEGDTVVIDFVGKKDGVAFDGGTSSNYELKIGSGNFIDGFEEGLVGVMPGETVDLDLTFPDPYPNNPDLANAAVVFTVTVHYIKTTSTEVPELTDELVRTFTDYETVAEYEAGIRATLSKGLLQSAVQDFLFNGATVIKLPEDALKVYRDRFINIYKDQAAAYGISFTDFLKQNGTNEVNFLAQAKQSATNAVTEDLILNAVAREQNISVTEEARERAMEDLLEDYKDQYSLSTTDDLLELLAEDADTLIFKRVVLNFLYDNAKIEG